MNDLLSSLYEYIRKHELGKYLLDEEYHKAKWAINRQQEKLIQDFPAAQGPLENLLGEIFLQQSFEMEAMFQAALALSTDLARL